MISPTYLSAAPKYLMYGAAAGVGTRLIKNLFDIVRRGSQTEVETLNLSETPVASVPMEVSEEEAEELRRKGIKVKRILEKQPTVKEAADDYTAGAKIGLGATAAAAALAGWKFSDWLVDKARKSVVEGDLDKLRKRVKRVIDDSPEDSDIPLHAYMKAAEVHYFEKKAGIGDVFNTGAGWAIPDPILQGLGGIGILGLVAAYNQVSEESKYKAKVKGLKSYMKYKPTETTTVTIDPVVVQRTPGSPAGQAEVNAEV